MRRRLEVRLSCGVSMIVESDRAVSEITALVGSKIAAHGPDSPWLIFFEPGTEREIAIRAAELAVIREAVDG